MSDISSGLLKFIRQTNDNNKLTQIVDLLNNRRIFTFLEKRGDTYIIFVRSKDFNDSIMVLKQYLL